jgi:hypothetical protein
VLVDLVVLYCVWWLGGGGGGIAWELVAEFGGGLALGYLHGPVLLFAVN